MENPIRRQRLAYNYSQQDLADMAGVTVQSIKLYEAGQKKPPNSVRAVLGIKPVEFEEWVHFERALIHEFIRDYSVRALSGKSNEFCANAVYFKRQLSYDAEGMIGRITSFDKFIKTYFTSKSFCSKLLLINYSSLDRHINGFPVPLREALTEIGLSAWAKRKEAGIYG